MVGDICWFPGGVLSGLRKLEGSHSPMLGLNTLRNQWLILVPLKGGRSHIIPQLAVYTTYIPLIYCLLGGYILPTTLYRNLKNPLKKVLDEQVTRMLTNVFPLEQWCQSVSCWLPAKIKHETPTAPSHVASKKFFLDLNFCRKI